MKELVSYILERAARDPAFRDVVLNHPEQLLQDFPLTPDELSYLQQLSPADLVGANPGPTQSPGDLVGAQPGPPQSPLNEISAQPGPQQSPLGEVSVNPGPTQSPGDLVGAQPGPTQSPGDLVGLNPQPLPPSGAGHPSVQPGSDVPNAAEPAIIAGIAIPKLIRGRVSSNESATIGDVRTVISGESADHASGQGALTGQDSDVRKRRKPSRIPVAAFIGIIAVLLLLGLGVIAVIIGGNLGGGNDNAVENPPSDDGSFTPIPVGIGATAEDETAEPTGEPAGEGDTTGGSSGGATGGSTATCGDGVCDPASENSDLCPADCQCVDDGVCSPGEGANCHDCGSSAGTCGTVCSDSSQCAGGLACAGGTCWDACICGGDCATTGDGGSTGGSSGGSCPCSCTTVCDPAGGGCVTTCADCTGALCTP